MSNAGKANDLESLWNTYNTLNEWIRFSDTKATALLAINGVLTGFYFSNMNELKTILADKPITSIPLLLAAILIFLSALSSMCCIIPRLKINRKDSLIFFSDIAKNYQNSGAYEKAIEESLTSDTLKTEISSQIWANSKVAVKKYDSVTYSVVFFVFAIFFSLLLLALWLL